MGKSDAFRSQGSVRGPCRTDLRCLMAEAARKEARRTVGRRAQTTTALQPGECETVSCTWDTPPTAQGERTDVRVVVDDDGYLTECHEGNNEGVVYGVLCAPPR